MEDYGLSNILNVFLRTDLPLYGRMGRIYVRMSFMTWESKCYEIDTMF